MDEDIIVVVDEPASGPPSQQIIDIPVPAEATQQPEQPFVPSTSSPTVRTSSRLRAAPSTTRVISAEPGERQTRSARIRSQKFNAPKKLKLKLNEKATAAQAFGTSFLGPYDRELDSDDEDLAFEEQFILRLPPGEDCERLRKRVVSRDISNDVWFKFKGEQS